MKLTKRHREALEQAKIDLRTTDIEYICHAVNKSVLLNSFESKELQEAIQASLKICNSVETWLIEKQGEFFLTLIKYYGSKKQALIEYRCAWIDAILKRGSI